MKATPLAIPEVILFEPRAFEDERGLFFESFNQKLFEEAVGHPVTFVQDNHSISKKGVLRGLHFQRPPFAQGKLVRVVRGAAFDGAVDIRGGSPTYGKWVAEILSAENRKQLWIPQGFAHGFLALKEGTEFLYKTTNFYDKASEGGIRWDHPAIGVEWPFREVMVSSKDRQLSRSPEA
jgi:dTDP-4-dehydrorhamnose 3,5-epimerase